MVCVRSLSLNFLDTGHLTIIGLSLAGALQSKLCEVSTNVDAALMPNEEDPLRFEILWEVAIQKVMTAYIATPEVSTERCDFAVKANCRLRRIRISSDQ